jgi:hypothetical protein
MQRRHQVRPLSFAVSDPPAIASATPPDLCNQTPKEIVMNPIRIIGRLTGVLAGLAAALAAAVLAAPAAFAATRPSPPPGVVSRFEPVAHTFNGVTGDMTGWQITLIAVGAAIVGAAMGVLLDRARAARWPSLRGLSRTREVPR